jgi:hypothetical protein
MDFRLSTEHEQMRDKIRRFCQAEIRMMRSKFSGRHRPVSLLSNRSLALMMCFRSPQLSQLRFAAVEFVSITPPDSLNRVRLGPESTVRVLPHRPSLPVPWNHRG